MQRRPSVVVAIVSAMALTIPATDAQATIDACTQSTGYNSHTAYCTGSAPSQFRAWVKCLYDPHPHFGVNEGPWRSAGGGTDSQAVCLPGWSAVGGGVDTLP